ncbi:U-box domain-containing protein 35-like isoform X2 [Macadamia integrifolia]|uniref:U-box domain-containing protein 35-like isoform X2 n=1 Tax=Macadamia integrifolia TaxID=60698 RepID=UPI001C4E9CFD|nr:U-box domain-containing protein 35-like isoform X2 [Macadamia integrifolia]
MRTRRAMDRKGTFETEKELAEPTPPMFSVAVAITGSKNSVMVVKWALESFISDVKVLFKLLHVRAPNNKSNDPDDKIMVRCFPAAQLQEDMVAKHKKDRQTAAMLFPFKRLCTRRKVEVDVTVIEGDDIADAIMKEISYSKITKLVIGASPRTMFTRKVKSNSISSRILEGAAVFCAVYVVSKGNLTSMRPSNPELSPSTKGERENDAVDPNSRRSSSPAPCIEQPDNGSSVFGKASTLKDNRSGLSEEEFTFSPVADAAVSRQFDKWFIFGSKITSKVSTCNGNASRLSDKGFPLGTARNDLTRISDKGSIIEDSENNRTSMSDERPTLKAATDNGSREFGKASTLEENGSKPFHRRYTSDTILDTAGSRRFDKGNSFDIAIDTGSRMFSNLSEKKRSKVFDKGTFGTVLSTTQSMIPAKASTFKNMGSREFSSKGFTVEVTTDNASKIFKQITMLEAPESSSSDCEDAIIQELEGLGVDRRLLDTLYAKSQRETIDATDQKKNNPSKHWMEQTIKPNKKTFEEENTRELVRPEKEEEYEAVKQKEAQNMRESVQAEAKSDAIKKRKLDKATILHSDELCNMFTWEDIVSATSSFSNDLLIGRGASGSVYKCKLHHTTTAVKVLHFKESHWTQKFHQELEILSKIRHPHLLLLLGAFPERGCLVYEHMEKGSLDDRLLRKDNTPPIPWFERYRIAWEIASALLFLHNAKPKPIIHRNLKPANILLDHNYVSKIGDVGLSTLLSADNATVFKGTSPVGSLCYIDPEYQRTGMISPKSDVYAFGIVIMQLLTAKPAIALARFLEKVPENGGFMGILDSEAGNWPVEETQELAALGLSCTELQHHDRPDLKARILPVLEKLKGIAERARDSMPCAPSFPPQCFICPILQEVMNEPCIASDGYTYDRRAIEVWLKDNDNSPLTNLPLPNKNLIQDFTLHTAIVEWKSKMQQHQPFHSFSRKTIT